MSQTSLLRQLHLEQLLSPFKTSYLSFDRPEMPSLFCNSFPFLRAQRSLRARSYDNNRNHLLAASQRSKRHLWLKRNKLTSGWADERMSVWAYAELKLIHIKHMRSELLSLQLKLCAIISDTLSLEQHSEHLPVYSMSHVSLAYLFMFILRWRYLLKNQHFTLNVLVPAGKIKWTKTL